MQDKENNKLLNIVMITDNNYVMPTLVAITSIIENRKESTYYSINILTNNLSDENISILKSGETTGVQINIIDKSELLESFNGVKQNRHVTTTAILKFYIPDIFCDVDKILYLDGDILVQDDLKELYDTDIKDFYAAVVKDTLSVVSLNHLKNHLIDNEFYFNSGVMLFNLERMRRDNITEKLIEYKNKVESFFMDQDAFNAVIGSNVKFISYKYNFLNYYTDALWLDDLERFFGEKMLKDRDEIFKICTILHLGGKEKPWKYEMGYLSSLYDSYYKKTVYGTKPLDLKLLPEKPFVYPKFSFFERIFSIKNASDRRYKVISILGIMFKLKRKMV